MLGIRCNARHIILVDPINISESTLPCYRDKLSDTYLSFDEECFILLFETSYLWLGWLDMP